MKKRTIFGISLCILCMLGLIGLGVYLMFDMQNITFLKRSPISEETASVSAPLQTEREAQRQTEAVTEAAAHADEQTAAALRAAQAANAALPKHQFIFVGDSRTLGMGNAEKDLDDSCCYIGATGEGYYWFTEDGLSQMEEAMQLYPDAPIIFNLGVNDPDMIDHYLELYSTFSETYPGKTFYYMSVNPVTEESVHVTNAEIADFNAKLRDAFSEQYLDCNTYLRIREFESVDGVHYSEDTYRAIHDFVVEQLQ